MPSIVPTVSMKPCIRAGLAATLILWGSNIGIGLWAAGS